MIIFSIHCNLIHFRNKTVNILYKSLALINRVPIAHYLEYEVTGGEVLPPPGCIIYNYIKCAVRMF